MKFVAYLFVANVVPVGVVKGPLIIASIVRKRNEFLYFVPGDELKLTLFEALMTPRVAHKMQSTLEAN